MGKIEDLEKIAELKKIGALTQEEFEKEKSIILNANTNENEEKSVFNIVLENSGRDKIKVVNIIRTITGLSLKETVNIVDNAPKTIKENVSKDEASKIKSDLEEVGAIIKLV